MSGYQFGRKADKKMKLAWVGAGYQSTHNLCSTIPFIPEIDFVAICDVVEEKAKENARRFGALRYYTDIEKMFENEEIDGVGVVGQPDLQLEAGLYFLEKGIPVFIEKPIALTVEDAFKLVKMAEDKGTFGMTAFMKRFAVAYRAAKKIATSEEFGRVSLVDVKFGHGPSGIWCGQTEIMAGLLCMGVHVIDLARFYGGEIKEVYSKLCQRENKGQYAIATTVEFENGAVGLINENGNEFELHERLSLSGEDALITVEHMDRLKYQNRRKDRWVTDGEYGMVNAYYGWDVADGQVQFDNSDYIRRGYYGEVRDFALSCLQGSVVPLASTLKDGYEAIRVAQAIVDSIESHKPISL